MENGGSGLTQKKFVMLQLLLRPLSALFSVVAALVMVLSKETRDLTGHQMTASYSISPELRFFVVGNFLSCGYALLSLPLVSIPANSFILYVLDLMNMALIVSAVSVGTAIGSLAKKGHQKLGWMELCSFFESFCLRGEIAMGFFLLASFFLLSCFLSQICAIKRLKKEQQQQNNNRI
ncbi:hypothetical protein HPP92_028017 [Vanilla planifolia]|uniref:CASP-like protein n=1 Tax=Vanilla planifolia TaxID=51239 RepID=A0A835P9H1_VANPL|nr:hypothetical protein HPP92_028017 [Vanilla planifolia]